MIGRRMHAVYERLLASQGGLCWAALERELGGDPGGREAVRRAVVRLAELGLVIITGRADQRMRPGSLVTLAERGRARPATRDQRLAEDFRGMGL